LYKYTEKEINEIVANATIIVDSREKENKHITKYFTDKNVNWAVEKLDYGDYSMRINLSEDNRPFYLTDHISIERKASLNELSGNLTHNRDRFTAEFERAKGKMYLLIENANYEDIEKGLYTTKFNKQAFRASLDAFEQRYNINIHYQKDASVSGYWIYRTLTSYLKELLKQGKI
jgi:ERCC4-type nuclease